VDNTQADERNTLQTAYMYIHAVASANSNFRHITDSEGDY